jgi:ribosomal-protein-alanine N-acetyltransferase
MNALLAPDPVLRAMATMDLDAVLAIEASAYSFPWSRGNFIDSLAAGYHAQVLVDAQAGIVGYFVAMAGVEEMHLLNITVAPPWQGRGLACAMLDALEAGCRERRLAMLWLEVRSSNQRARALYARRGFAEVGVRRGYYPAAFSKREDAVVMSRRLLAEDSDALD